MINWMELTEGKYRADSDHCRAPAPASQSRCLPNTRNGTGTAAPQGGNLPHDRTASTGFRDPCEGITSGTGGHLYQAGKESIGTGMLPVPQRFPHPGRAPDGNKLHERWAVRYCVTGNRREFHCGKRISPCYLPWGAGEKISSCISRKR
jgi:hypothetical protein